MEFSDTLRVFTPIPSTNEHKLPVHRNGKTWLYKNPEVDKFQRELISQCYDSNLFKIKEIADQVEYTEELELVFHINKNFWRRDTTNMVKIVEDGLVEFTKIDDSKTIKNVCSKVLSGNNEYEEIFVRFKFKMKDV